MPNKGQRIWLLLGLFCFLGGETFAVDSDHWAFAPPERPPVPVVGLSSGVRNPIDAFILEGLEANGLKACAGGGPGHAGASVVL